MPGKNGGAAGGEAARPANAAKRPTSASSESVPRPIAASGFMPRLRRTAPANVVRISYGRSAGQLRPPPRAARSAEKFHHRARLRLSAACHVHNRQIRGDAPRGSGVSRPRRSHSRAHQARARTVRRSQSPRWPSASACAQPRHSRMSRPPPHRAPAGSALRSWPPPQALGCRRSSPPEP